MLKERKDQGPEDLSEGTRKIDFKTAKNINNDLVDILEALLELRVRSEAGKEIKEKFIEIIRCKLVKLESSNVQL